MPDPAYRYLKGYTIDPGFSTRLDTMGINEMVYRIKWEDLDPGPIGEYVEVIDLDPPNGYFYEPVDLDSKEILASHGLAPSEGNAQFHQQFVYTIIMQTIQSFENALGRKITWRKRLIPRGSGLREEYVQQLRVYPHAMRDANAFYAQDKVALLFGYFEAGFKLQGSNFPGGAVFTCLSPDIIAHETTHAILDSIHPRYLENTNADVPAFHEGFADIVALLQRFSNKVLVEHQLELTQGRLDEYSVLGELATQFGQALRTGRGALRSAIGKYDENGKWQRLKPDPTAYQTVFEAHQRGAILVATIFDAFMRLYTFKTKDLLRIASQGTGILPPGSVQPDLIKRLAEEAGEIANHLCQVCIRAIDYCPPFDITFGSYLRALITADIDFAPEDENGYRVALIEAFRAWGIFPDRVNTLSIHSLQWGSPELTNKEERGIRFVAEFLKDEISKLSVINSRKETSDHYSIIQARLHDLLIYPAIKQPALWKKHALDEKTWQGFLDKLGIVFGPLDFEYEEDTLHFAADVPLEVHNVRPAFRNGRENRQVEQVVVTLTQTLRVNTGKYKYLRFRGGCTIIFGISGSNLRIDYIISKNIRSKRRLTMQLDYQFRKTPGFSLTESLYESDKGFDSINFEKLHFH